MMSHCHGPSENTLVTSVSSCCMCGEVAAVGGRKKKGGKEKRKKKAGVAELPRCWHFWLARNVSASDVSEETQRLCEHVSLPHVTALQDTRINGIPSMWFMIHTSLPSPPSEFVFLFSPLLAGLYSIFLPIHLLFHLVFLFFRLPSVFLF